MYLVAQSTYDQIDFGIFQDGNCLKSSSINKIEATQLLIPELDILMNSLKIRLSYLDFIAVSRGPAPFTTLRVLLSTVNAIALSTKIPLIEVDSLELLLRNNSSHEKYTLVLLNAFSDDAYYALKTPEKITYGCKNIDSLVNEIKFTIQNEKIKIVGNGVEKFQEQIKQLNYFCLENNPKYTTLQEISDESLKKWNQKKITAKILPFYLKEAIKL